MEDNTRHIYNVIGVLTAMLGIAFIIGLFKIWYGLW
jgi:uncharacterized membrane protein YkgB